MPSIPPGAVPSPNIWNSPQIYEMENRAVDPDGIAEAAMREIRPWDGGSVLGAQLLSCPRAFSH